MITEKHNLVLVSTTRMKKLLTVKEVQQILRVSRSTIYQWIREGALPVVNLRKNGARRILRIEQRKLEVFLYDKGREVTSDQRRGEKMGNGR